MIPKMTIVYQVKKALYVNLTNRCPCACRFCLRQNAPGVYGSQSLWLEREPTVQEVISALVQWDLDRYPEVVFCGYGEPTERLDDLLEIADDRGINRECAYVIIGWCANEGYWAVPTLKGETSQYYFDYLCACCPINYYFDEGIVTFGWAAIDGKYYLFDRATGKAVLGWLPSEGHLIYISAEDGIIGSQSRVIDGILCTFDSHGWLIEGGQAGTVPGEDGRFLDEDGKIRTGYFEKNGEWYYTD